MAKLKKKQIILNLLRSIHQKLEKVSKYKPKDLNLLFSITGELFEIFLMSLESQVKLI